MQYEVGQIVGYVDINQLRGPIETPMPQKWYVLMTFPNKEAKVMRTFKDRNISAYHPVIRRTRIIRGRRNDCTAPLFASLIFIPDFQARAGGVFVDGVDRYLKFGDCYPYLPQCAPPIKLAEEAWQSRYVRKDENLVPDMVGIRQLEAVGNIPVVRRRRLYRVGQLVRVVGGPFASFNGMIEHLDSNGRLKVLLDIFSRLTPVELDQGQIEAA
jgi:transcriptional antiterminator NusG